MKKLIILIIILFIAITSIIYFFHPQLENLLESFATWTYPENENRVGESIKLIMNIAAGIVIIIGLYATIIRAHATQQSVEKQGASIKNQSHQIELTRKSQTNEQFKNAIEHLGSDKEPIILGGIAELHQIASEENSEFKEVVFNILCSFIRSIAKKDKHGDDINYTIVQTIINYLFKTEIYKDYSPDLRYTNLISANIDNVTFKNGKFNFCHLPFKISNTEFINCDLSSTKNFGRYKNIKFENCNLFQFITYYSKFENLEIINENGKNYSLYFLDSEFKNSILQTDLFQNQFLACEFKATQFEAKSFLNTNFYGSSFNEVKFKVADISGSNFAACGFQNTVIDSAIFNTNFNGSDNEIKYFSHFISERLEKRIGKEVNLSGLNLDNSTLLKCTFEPLSKEEASNLNKEYQKQEELYNTKKVERKREKEKGTTGNIG